MSSRRLFELQEELDSLNEILLECANNLSIQSNILNEIMTSIHTLEEALVEEGLKSG